MSWDEVFGNSRNNSDSGMCYAFSYAPFYSNTTTQQTRKPLVKDGLITGRNIGGGNPTDNGEGGGDNNTSTFAQNAEVGVNIAGATMGVIGGISNMALGWANYAEQKKNSEMQRALAAKQLENLTEIMQQRKDELARLNRVRGNTKKAFSSNTTVTRSVL